MRGVIEYRGRSLQVNDFSGIHLPGGITPTDIDGAIEVAGVMFVFFELKSLGTPIKNGQRLFLERIVDAIQGTRSNNDRVVFGIVADHETPLGTDIDAANSIVREYRWMFQWRNPQRLITLGSAVEKIYHDTFADPF